MDPKKLRTFSKDTELVKRRRKFITDQAVKLFLKKGYPKSSIRKIAEVCGMSIGTLYHYIGSKDDILYLLSEEAALWVSDFVDETLSISRTLNSKENLKQTIERYIKWVDDIQDIVIFWYQETRNLPKASRNSIFNMERQLVDMFSKLLIEGCKKGEFNIDNITLVAHNVVVLSDMWAFRRWSLSQTFTLKQYIKYQSQIILKLIT